MKLFIYNLQSELLATKSIQKITESETETNLDGQDMSHDSCHSTESV